MGKACTKDSLGPTDEFIPYNANADAENDSRDCKTSQGSDKQAKRFGVFHRRQPDAVIPLTPLSPSEAGRGQWATGGERKLFMDAACVVGKDAEARPPHLIVQEQTSFLPGTVKFYVSIYSLMASNLPWVAQPLPLPTPEAPDVPAGDALSSLLQQLHLTPAGGKSRPLPVSPGGGVDASHLNVPKLIKNKCFLTIHWDDNSYARRTVTEEGEGAHVRWHENLRFFWECSQISEIANRCLDIRVWQEGLTNNDAYLMGKVSVNLGIVATGPIHHDLPIVRWQSNNSPSLDLETVKSSNGPNLVLETAGKGRLQFDIRMSQICSLFITPIEILAHINDPYSKDNGPEMPRGGSREGSSELAPAQLMKQKSSIHGATSVPAISEVDVVARAADTISGDDEEVAELERSAVGGHTAEDSKESIVAKWRVTFLPTGVFNPTEYASSWTDLCCRPYWNSLNEGFTDDVSNKLQSPKINSSTPPPSLKSVPDQMATRSPLGAFNKGGPVLSQSPAEDQTEIQTQKLSGLQVGLADRIRLSAISKRDQKVFIYQSKGLIDNQISMSGIPDLQSLSSILKFGSSNGHLPNQPQTPLASLTGPFNIQQSYQTLAAACRRGSLARSLLRPILPTCQLKTTCDILRQHHLNLRVYAKPLGIGSPKLYGEAWVPFFKLYDADVVEHVNQNFFDSYFSEKLWQEGRCVGRLEGLIVFQDNPLMRQMLAGVHTERGFDRIAPPILGSENKSLKLKFQRDTTVPTEIQNLAQQHAELLDQLYVKTQSTSPGDELTAMTNGENKMPSVVSGGDTLKSAQKLQTICDTVLTLLATNHLAVPEGQVAKCSYLYTGTSSLLTAQKILLNLASHCLDYIDYVPWHFRGTYGAILMAVLKRGELDVGNILPSIPKCARHLTTEDLKTVISVAKEMMINQSNNLSNSLSDMQSLIIETPNIPGKRVAPKKPESPEKRPHRRSSHHNSPTKGSPGSSHKSNSPLKHSIADSSSHAKWIEFLETLKPPELLDLVLYHKRLKACRTYHAILEQVLHYCLSKVQSEALFEAQRRYVSSFLAMAYFRLPSFREQLLNKVLTEAEMKMEIPEWRGTEFSLDESSLIKLNTWQSNKIPGVYELQLALDWEAFHTTLRNYFGAESLDHGLAGLALPDIKGWDESFLRPRGLNFLAFLENWCKNTYSSLLSQRRAVLTAFDANDAGAMARGPVDRPRERSLARQTDPAFMIQTGRHRWDLVPGFATMVKALLITMKSQGVEKYPDALLNCTGALLVNERLLTVFVKIVFLKTTIYSRDQVFSAFNYLDFWLQVLSLRHRPLPPAFDHRFLVKGLEVVLECDLALQTAKGLWFLYKRLDFFHGFKLKTLLYDLLLCKNFERLFLSWSWLVRRCFIWILLYRLCEATRNVLTKISFEGQMPVIIGHENPSPEIDKPRQYVDVLTIEEKLYCWCYVLFCRHLSNLGINHVFPKELMYRHLPVLLGTTAETKSRVIGTDGEFNLGACLALPVILPPLCVSSARSAFVFPASEVGIQEFKVMDQSSPRDLWGRRVEVLGPSGDRGIDALVSSFMQHGQPASPNVNKSFDSHSVDKKERRLISRLMAQRSPKSSAPSDSAKLSTKGSPGLRPRRLSADTDDARTSKLNGAESPTAAKRRFYTRWRHEGAEQEESQKIPPVLDLPVAVQSNDGYSSDKERSPCVEYVNPCALIPVDLVLQQQNKAYVSLVTIDLARELAAYQAWVAAGPGKLPPLHIPASPLDTNVDIPLDESW